MAGGFPIAVTTVPFTQPPVPKVHPFLGFGAQLNANLFTTTGGFMLKVQGRPPQAQDLTPGQRERLLDAIKDLRPGHCRIFVPRGLDPDTDEGRRAPEFVALMNTIRLAQEARASVNLTWWGQGPYARESELRALSWPTAPHTFPPQLVDLDHPHALPGPKEKVHRFARIIREARREFDCVTHATIQNEPNGGQTDIAQKTKPALSMRFYELLYRHFTEALATIPDPQHPGEMLLDAIDIVAGDLLDLGKTRADDQGPWLRFMHANMDKREGGQPSLLDAYSIHVYWEPGEFPKKPFQRLETLARTMQSLQSDRPVYVTEFGVRKLVQIENQRPGSLDGVKMEHSPEAAFMTAWFSAMAPQRGCAGLVKWAFYRTDLTSGWGHWGMIDAPGGGFVRTPVYRVMRLFTHAVGLRWTATGLGESADRDILASRFLAPNGDDQAVLVLNKGDGARDVQVASLRKNRTYHLADWNRDAAGGLLPLDSKTTGDGGTLTVTVPRHGVVALSTIPLGL